MSVDRERAERAVREYLAAVGLDPGDPRLRRTPERVARASQELYAGVGVDAAALLAAGRIPLGVGDDQEASWPDAPGRLVALDRLSFRSICEHHLLPFTGTAAIVYEPGAAIAGFGRIADVLRMLAARPTLQERLGDDLARTLVDALGARGALVVIDAVQVCMTLGDAPQADPRTVSVSALGTLVEPARRDAALALLAAPARRSTASRYAAPPSTAATEPDR